MNEWEYLIPYVFWYMFTAIVLTCVPLRAMFNSRKNEVYEEDESEIGEEMNKRELSDKAPRLVGNFEESVIRYHAAKHLSRKDAEYYESARKELLDYIQSLENGYYNLIAEGRKLGIHSEGWDKKVSEYRHWDL